MTLTALNENRVLLQNRCEVLARKGRYRKPRDNLEVKEVIVGAGERINERGFKIGAEMEMKIETLWTEQDKEVLVDTSDGFKGWRDTFLGETVSILPLFVVYRTITKRRKRHVVRATGYQTSLVMPDRGTGMRVAASRPLFWIPAFARMTEARQAAGYWTHFE